MSDPTTSAHAAVSVCTTAKNTDQTLTAFAALTWVPIGFVGKLGGHGYKTNMIAYSVLDRDVTLKAKGETDGGDLTIECAENSSDAGQIALDTCALPGTPDSFVVKIDYANGDVRYIRGPIGGPEYNGGGNQDFRTSTYTVGVNQLANVPA